MKSLVLWLLQPPTPNITVVGCPSSMNERTRGILGDRGRERVVQDTQIIWFMIRCPVQIYGVTLLAWFVVIDNRALAELKGLKSSLEQSRAKLVDWCPFIPEKPPRMLGRTGGFAIYLRYYLQTLPVTRPPVQCTASIPNLSSYSPYFSLSSAHTPFIQPCTAEVDVFFGVVRG